MADEITIEFAAVAALVKELGANLTIFDLEATTFRGRKNFGITEVGCFTVTQQGTGLIYGHLINPERTIDAAVVELTGITPAMVANKEVWGHRYAKLFQQMAQDQWVGGFNIKTFDCPAVIDMNDRYGYPIANGFSKVLDVRTLYLALEKPVSKKGKLIEIAEFYSVSPKGSVHRAQADVVLTVETLNAMVLGYGVSAVIEALLPAKTVPVTKPVRPAKATSSAIDVQALTKVIINNPGITTVANLAKQLGADLKTTHFALGSAIDGRLIDPKQFAIATTQDWLSDMIIETPTELLVAGKLAPMLQYFDKQKPAHIELDYIQLRIALLASELTWQSLVGCN